MAVFALIEAVELLREPVLGLERDGDDLRRLSLATAVEDERGGGPVSVVPCRLNEDPAGVDVAGLGDRTATLAFT